MSIALLFENKDYENLKWLYEHRCKQHGHRYLEHYTCYQRECDKPERIGFFDIESGGSLTADWGVLLSWAIKPLGSNDILGGTVQEREIIDTTVRDKYLIKVLCAAMKQFDTLIVYYGKDLPYRHDFPFSRTRALTHNLTCFPQAGSLKVVDVYDIIKNKFKLTIRKQEAACRQFNVPYGKHYATPNIWLSAIQGSQKALNYVWLHNCEDVRSLERLWKKVCGFSTTRNKI